MATRIDHIIQSVQLFETEPIAAVEPAVFVGNPRLADRKTIPLFALNALDDDFEQDVDDDTACDEESVLSFLALFPHRNESGVRYSDFSEWREVSRFHCLTDEEILSALRLDSKLRRAVRFDAASHMQVLRVPADSVYFNATSADLLKKQFLTRGITVKHYQYNTDWFFYVFFIEPGDVAAFAKRTSNMLHNAGFTVSPETLIVMQSDDLLPLPVQPGFCWINESGAVSVRRDEISLQGALSLFLSDSIRHAVDYSDASENIVQPTDLRLNLTLA
jgi:hypothetical protein